MKTTPYIKNVIGLLAVHRQLSLIGIFVILAFYIGYWAYNLHFKYYWNKPAAFYVRHLNTPSLASLNLDCSKTIVVSGYYSNLKIFTYTPTAITQHASFYPRAKIYTSAYYCPKQEVISAVKYKKGYKKQRISTYGFNRYTGDKSIYTPLHSEPSAMVFYKGKIITTSSLIKCYPIGKYGDLIPGAKNNLFDPPQECTTSMLYYDLYNQTIERKIPFTSFYCRTAKIVDNTLHVVGRSDNYYQINLDTWQRKAIHHAPRVYWRAANDAEIAAEKELGTWWDSGHSFALLQGNMYALSDIPSYRELYVVDNIYKAYKDVHLYKLDNNHRSRVTKILTLPYKDIYHMISDDKYLYIFTINSQKVLRFNPITAKLDSFDVPITGVYAVSHTKDALVVAHIPPKKSGKNNNAGYLTVVDKNFNWITPSINLNMEPEHVSTAVDTTDGLNFGGCPG